MKSTEAGSILNIQAILFDFILSIKTRQDVKYVFNLRAGFFTRSFMQIIRQGG